MATSTKAKTKRNGPKRKKAYRKWKSSSLWNSANGERHNANEYSQWSKYLKNRKRSNKVEKILKDSLLRSLGWMVDKQLMTAIGPSCGHSTKGGKKKGRNGRDTKVLRMTDDDARRWLATLSERTPSVTVGLGGLAWCHELVASCDELQVESWCNVLDSLIDLATMPSIKAGDDESHSLVEQLLLVELPLALNWQFPEIERCSDLGESAANRLSSNIVKLSDGVGVIHGEHFQVAGPLAASWVRCMAVLEDVKGCKVSRGARDEFDWMIRNLLRWSRADGMMPFALMNGDPVDEPDLSRVIMSGLRITEDEEDRAIAKMRLNGKKVSAARVPNDASLHSEWSGISVLQSSWQRDSPKLLVDHSGPSMRLELETEAKTLFSTDWEPTIVVNGERLAPVTEVDTWEAVCWFEDVDSDYLELEADLPNEWKLQRQILLGKEDRFLLLCDSLIGPNADTHVEIDYQLTIPLAGRVQVRRQGDAREGLISAPGKKRLAMVLPLALPEWRNAPGLGELDLSGGEIQLNHRSKGRALCAPIFFDLDVDRLRLPRTWRRLTVAETRRAVPHDEAVGFRIQVGSQQWLMYRSLTANGNRTLIGQNLSSEFLFARIDMDGAVEALVETDPSHA